MAGLRSQITITNDKCQKSILIYNWMATETADLSAIEGVVAASYSVGLRFGNGVIIKLMVWMSESRLRVADYTKQCDYFTDSIRGLFHGLDASTARQISLNAMESTVIRLMSVVTEDDVAKGGPQTMMLQECVNAFIDRGSDLLAWVQVCNVLPLVRTLSDPAQSDIQSLTRLVELVAPLAAEGDEASEVLEDELRNQLLEEPLVQAILIV